MQLFSPKRSKLTWNLFLDQIFFISSSSASRQTCEITCGMSSQKHPHNPNKPRVWHQPKKKKDSKQDSAAFCAWVCLLSSLAARWGGKGEREKEEDANKPEPGVFVSECVSADVNSVPLWRRRCLWRGKSQLVCPAPLVCPFCFNREHTQNKRRWGWEVWA